jgi:hypothetical protein
MSRNAMRFAPSGKALTGALTAALATGVLAAPIASAQPGEPTQTYAKQIALPYQGTHVPVAPDDLRSPDAIDAATPSRPAPVTPATPTSVSIRPAGGSTSDDGFAWGDAAIGAGGAVAAFLLASGGAVAVGRRKHRPTAKAAGVTG